MVHFLDVRGSNRIRFNDGLLSIDNPVGELLEFLNVELGAALAVRENVRVTDAVRNI